MTTLRYTKRVEDIEEPEAMPPDWYVFQVTKEPEVKPNKKKLAKKTYEEGAGDNLEIPLVLVSDIAEYNGRRFTAYLPNPEPRDEEVYDGRGMKVYDAKLNRIAKFAMNATGCIVDGEDITIMPNARVGIYVSRGIDPRDPQGQKMTNNLECFSPEPFISPDRVGIDEDASEYAGDNEFPPVDDDQAF